MKCKQTINYAGLKRTEKDSAGLKDAWGRVEVGVGVEKVRTL